MQLINVRKKKKVFGGVNDSGFFHTMSMHGWPLLGFNKLREAQVSKSSLELKSPLPDKNKGF